MKYLRVGRNNIAPNVINRRSLLIAAMVEFDCMVLVVRWHAAQCYCHPAQCYCALQNG